MPPEIHSFYLTGRIFVQSILQGSDCISLLILLYGNLHPGDLQFFSTAKPIFRLQFLHTNTVYNSCINYRCLLTDISQNKCLWVEDLNKLRSFQSTSITAMGWFFYLSTMHLAFFIWPRRQRSLFFVFRIILTKTVHCSCVKVYVY